MDGCRLVYGVVSDNSKMGYARVMLPTYDDVVTDWLPIVKPRAMGDDENWPLAINEQVAVLVDEWCVRGVILGATSNDVDEPDSEAAVGKWRKKFADGTYMEYDSGAHVLKLSVGSTVIEVSNSETSVVMGTTKLTMTAAGHKIEANGQDLGSVLQDLVNHLSTAAITTPAGPGAFDPDTLTNLALDGVNLGLVLA